MNAKNDQREGYPPRSQLEHEEAKKLEAARKRNSAGDSVAAYRGAGGSIREATAASELRSEMRQSGAVDQVMFEKVIRDNLSPEGVAAIVAFLQPAAMKRPTTEEQRKALLEVEWFADTLLDLIGVEECNRIYDELCL